MEKVALKLEKDTEVCSLGRWPSTWKGRGVGNCTACSGASSWFELMLGSEQAQREEGVVKLNASKQRSDRSRFGS